MTPRAPNYGDLSRKRLLSEILSGAGRESRSSFATRPKSEREGGGPSYAELNCITFPRVTRKRDDITSMPNIFVLLDIRWNFPSNEMSGRFPLIRFREELLSFFGEIQFRLGSQILSRGDPLLAPPARGLGG